jgi:hypothetical protein
MECFGIPVDVDPKCFRRTEKMALSFLAVGNIRSIEDLKKCEDANTPSSKTTRQIISYINENFNENISSGSYDDIRRKDLKYPVLAEIVYKSAP